MATSNKASASRTLDNRIEALRSDLGALQTDVKGLANDAGVVANERINKTIRAAEDVAKRALNVAEDATSQAIVKVENWTDDNLDAVRTTIRNQPFYAIGLSMGLGAFVGAMLVRR